MIYTMQDKTSVTTINYIKHKIIITIQDSLLTTRTYKTRPYDYRSYNYVQEKILSAARTG